MTNIVELSIPAPDGAVVTEAQALLANAKDYRVTTAAQYSAAGELLKTIKGKARALDEQRKALTKPLDESKRRILDFFAQPLTFLEQAESAIKRGMIAFSQEQERQAREAQRRADEAARRERERIESQARKAAESGKVERAAALEQRAATVVAPVIQREAPKVTGVATREVPKFQIVDPAMLPREYLVPDEARIRRVVGALKLDANIPGVKVWMEKQLAAGTA